MILADDVLLDGSYLIIDEEYQIVAYSFLHTSEKDNTVELGWCGTHTIDDLSLLKLLVFEQFMYANKHGYSFIQGEFDSTSIYAMEILKSFPFNPCPTWITYQKKLESDETLSSFFYTASISNWTVIPLGSTTVNPFIVSFISCCFLLIFLSLHLTLLYAAVLSYTLLIQLHVPVGADYLLRSTYLRLYGDDILLQK